MRDFGKWMGEHQAEWREGRVSTSEHGLHGKKSQRWILPAEAWEEGLWPGLRAGEPDSIDAYLKREGASRHSESHNLKSSWVACANLYFPFRSHADDRSMLLAFLRIHVSDEIQAVDALELEYAEDGALHPTELLGEQGGSRGAGQTSPDLAFLVNGGKGIVLTESKLTESSFAECSARTTVEKQGRPANLDPRRCLNAVKVAQDPAAQCHQVVWGRKYWERLHGAINPAALSGLKACPAALGGYQLFRQQALAEGYTQKYDLVVSAVAYDERNEALVRCLKPTGICSFPTGWGKLFRGRAGFAAWTHQAWVEWVREHHAGRWGAWLEWIEERYGYAS